MVFGEYRRMPLSSSLVLSRGGSGNESLVALGQNQQSYYSDDESRRAKSYKGRGGKVQSSGQRDVLRPKPRTAASSSPSLLVQQDRFLMTACLLILPIVFLRLLANGLKD